MQVSLWLNQLADVFVLIFLLILDKEIIFFLSTLQV